MATLLPSDSAYERLDAIKKETYDACCIVVGDLNVDLKAQAESRWPTRNASTVGIMTRHAGGKGGNEATAVARLGIPTLMVARVGDDEHGEFLIRAMRADGISTHGIMRDPVRDVATSVALLVASKAHADSPAVKFTVQCQGANERLGERPCQEG